MTSVTGTKRTSTLGGVQVVFGTGSKTKKVDSFTDLALEHMKLDFWVFRSRPRSNDHHRGTTLSAGRRQVSDPNIAGDERGSGKINACHEMQTPAT